MLEEKSDKKDAVSVALPAPPPATAEPAANQPLAKQEAPLPVAPPPPASPAAAPAPNPVMSLRESTATEQRSPSVGYLAGNAGIMARAKTRSAIRQGAGQSVPSAAPSLDVKVLRNAMAVDPASVEFTHQDTVRLMVDVPETGYLYAIARQGSEPWRLIFPADTHSAATARMEPKASYLVPAGGPLHSNGPGDVTVHFIFSPNPLDLSGGPDTLAQAASSGPVFKSREIRLRFR